MRFPAIKLILVCGVSLAGLAAGVRGQNAADMPTQIAPMLGPSGPMTLFPILHPIKGEPFSGSFSVELKRALTDGTTISTARSGKLARDNEGRTYHEVTALRIGGPNRGTFTTINISDPASGTQVTLLPETHTARRFERVQRLATATANGAETRTALAASSTANPAPSTWDTTKSSLPAIRKEDLGVEYIEGVEVRHYRETQTIATGEIGNDRDVVIVSEFWYAKDLHLNLKAQRTDPRVGDETLTITDVVRAEPPLSMFEIPADYTVVESNMGGASVMGTGTVSAVTSAAPSQKP